MSFTKGMTPVSGIFILKICFYSNAKYGETHFSNTIHTITIIIYCHINIHTSVSHTYVLARLIELIENWAGVRNKGSSKTRVTFVFLSNMNKVSHWYHV